MNTTDSRLPLIGLVRASTNKQIASVEQQRQTLSDWAYLMNELIVIPEGDELESGAKKFRKPVQDALAQIARHEARGIVVTKLDRLARSLPELVRIVSELKTHNAVLIVIESSINTDTTEGMFFFHIMAAVAELERNLISERTKASAAHRKSQGKRVSGVPPYGYRLNVVGRLQEDEAEQHVISRIMEYFSLGVPWAMIVRQLEIAKLKPRSAERWSEVQLKRIIQREQRKGSQKTYANS